MKLQLIQNYEYAHKIDLLPLQKNITIEFIYKCTYLSFCNSLIFTMQIIFLSHLDRIDVMKSENGLDIVCYFFARSFLLQ